MAVKTFPLLPSGAGGVASAVVCSDGTDLVVDLRGEWDITTRPALCEVFFEVFAFGSGDVVVDLAETTFVDILTVRVLTNSKELLGRCRRQLVFRAPPRLASLMLHLFDLSEPVTGPSATSPAHEPW